MSNEIVEVLNQSRDKFIQLMPQGMQFEAEERFAIQILNNNPYLMGVALGNKNSLKEAVTNVAAIGLSLNPALKQAYLIPRNVKVKVEGKDKWVSKVFLEPSYIGLAKLGTDAGMQWVQADYVCKNDKFVDHGPGIRPDPGADKFSDRGEIVGFYCCAKTKEGDYLTGTMNLAEIHDIRGRSESFKSGKPGPWTTDFTEQGKKTVVRRESKLWPKSAVSRLDLAVDISNENEGFDPIVTAPEVSQCSVDQKKIFDDLITANDSLGMYVFMEGLDFSVQTSLNHSFEHGKKGTYQKIVNALTDAGRQTFHDKYYLPIKDRIDAVDNSGVLELFYELNQPAQVLLHAKIGEEYSQALREMLDNENL